MNIFFSDLDNTLIYSHRHEIPEPKITAEYYKGKEQSFITVHTLDFLERFTRQNLFIPLTTRTQEQYDRIEIFQKNIQCRYALICNGAMLLEDNVNKKEWEEESVRTAGESLNSIYYCCEFLKNIIHPEHLHYIEPFMVYAKCGNYDEIAELVRKNTDCNGLEIIYSSGKLFFIPEKLSKGNALKRFKEKIELQDTIISAGDSFFDISMLEISDYALCPDILKNELSNANMASFSGDFISDKICDYIDEHFLQD